MVAVDFDTILVGGGLQSGLLALALRARRPATRIALIERAARLGGNHTWCFHAGDLAPESEAWVAPLVCYRWPGYRVEFPDLQRDIQRSYCAITSDRLHDVVAAAITGHRGSRLWLDVSARRIEATDVEIEDGTVLSAPLVIDARGPDEAQVPAGATGYQKFLGMELELGSDHSWERPVLMDARVDQTDGFRFVYALPLSRRRVLVEDTVFATTPDLDSSALRHRIDAYVRKRGLDVVVVTREERGILPMPWSGGPILPRRGPLRAGYAGGWFHPGTGYSLPVAARLAEFIAARAPETVFGPALRALARDHAAQARYCRFLNRMLFRWYAPRNRWHIFQRFYRLPEGTIERFYALRLTAGDRARLLLGRPPQGFSLRHRLGLRGRVPKETS
jgi:lycopene beta-cyclase